MLAVFLAFVLNGLLDETFSSTSFGRLYYLAFGITLLLKDGIRCTRRRKECEFVVKTVTAPFGETVTVLSCLDYLLVIRIIKDGPFSILRSCICRF